MPIQKGILLAEDDAFLGLLLKKKLELEGFAVTLVTNGKDAIQHAQEPEKYSLLLLDLILPLVDGFEVLRQIRTNKNPEIAKLPVIVVSNLGSQSDMDRIHELGVKDYLVKARLTLPEIVAQVCRHAR